VDPIPITAVLEDVDGSGLASDVASDGLGPYQDNVGGITSVLLAAAYNNLTHGDWELEGRASTTRTARYTLDPADAVQPGDPAFLVPATPPFWGTENVRFHMQTKCTFVGNSMKAMTAGASFTCPLLQSIRRANGTNFGLQAAQSFTGFSETTDVRVVCNAADASGCTDWFVEPIPSLHQGQAIARLMQAASKPGKPNTHIGTFYIRFRVRLTRG
jgi:hypothetical protein